MRFVFGGIAIVLAIFCYVVFGQFLINAAGLDWTGLPRRLVRRPGDSAVGFGILLFGVVLMVIGVGLPSRRRDPPA